jgi:hypothetical protein
MATRSTLIVPLPITMATRSITTATLAMPL